MKARLGCIAWIVALVFAVVPLSPSLAAKPKASAKAPPPPAAEPSSLPAAELTLGFQSRDSETEGIGDLLIPLWNPGGRGLLFLNPRTAVTDHSAEEGNLGIGYRQLLPNLDLILGVNAFFDYRDTSAGNYRQWGFGLELLSPWIDARANYYDPENKKLVVASETESTSRQSLRTTASWSDVYPEDYGFYQDYVLTRTLTTETFTRTFEQYQQPLGGFDLEVGLRLPLPVPAETAEVRIFAGGYDFNRDFGPDAKGWKARAELRLLSSLFLDAGAYENDDLTGSDWFAGARLSVPLDLAALSRGRNPFDTARSRLDRAPRDFAARLTEMVQRDPQVRLETSAFIENKNLSSTSTQSQSTRTRFPLSILPDVVFVNGDARRPGNGSAARPFSSVQQGVDAAFGLRNVYVYAFSGPYNENVVLSPGTTLLGSGFPVQGLGGKAFGGGFAPVVDGLWLGPAITMARNSRVSGFRIRNTGSADWAKTFGDDPSGRLSPFPINHGVGIFAEGNLGDLTITHNLIEGCSYGTLVEARGSFSLLFADNVVRFNARDGIRISGLAYDGYLAGKARPAPLEPTLFNVVLSNNRFIGNAGYGAALRAGDYDLALTGLRDNRFDSNGRSGAFLTHRDCILSLIHASGGGAGGNEESGYLVAQYDNLASLLNLSGLSANGNGEFGARILQESDFLSATVVGMPQGLDSLVSGLVGLPDELAGFFQASGGVSASGNGRSGIEAEIYAQDMLAFGAFFDVAANRNRDFGLRAGVFSDDGIALALAGSSRNLSELAQLGDTVAGALGLDLPLAFSGNGRFQANDNGMQGLQLGAAADRLAVTGVLGAETSRNGDTGSYLFSESKDIAAILAARVTACDTALDGVHLISLADRLALGLLADLEVSRNDNNGLTAVVESEGTSALLALSTDALRPLASFLGEAYLDTPLALPGTPFGPVLANGNGQDGIAATVIGDDLALAAFLDVHANGNAGNGFSTLVESAYGQALTAFLSSDALYDLADEILGLPGEIGRPGLGGLQANGNLGCGILSETIGDESAYALFAGVQTSGNGPGLIRRGEILGDGIRAGLASDHGTARAILYGIDAHNNSGNGISLDAEALYNTDLVVLQAAADGNLRNGLYLGAASDLDDAFVLVAGADAAGNGQDGIAIQAVAGGDASVGVSAADFSGNGKNGLSALVQAGDYADFFVGDLAVDDLDSIYDFIDYAGPFGEVIPQGAVVSSGNGADGVHAVLTAGNNDATLVASALTADDNTGTGLFFDLDASAGPGSARAFLYGCQAVRNGDVDLFGTGQADSGDATILATGLIWNSYTFFVSSLSGSHGITINP